MLRHSDQSSTVAQKLGFDPEKPISGILGGYPEIQRSSIYRYLENQDFPQRGVEIHDLNTGACNNCDIEILNCLTPKFDLERFGVKLVGSIRHADCLLVTGPVTRKTAPRLKTLYEQVPRPCLVVVCGTCAISGGIFKGKYFSKPFYVNSKGFTEYLRVEHQFTRTPEHQ